MSKKLPAAPKFGLSHRDFDFSGMSYTSWLKTPAGEKWIKLCGESTLRGGPDTTIERLRKGESAINSRIAKTPPINTSAAIKKGFCYVCIVGHATERDHYMACDTCGCVYRSNPMPSEVLLSRRHALKLIPRAFAKAVGTTHPLLYRYEGGMSPIPIAVFEKSESLLRDLLSVEKAEVA